MKNQIRELIKQKLYFDKEISERYTKRLKEGKLIREENPESHFCVFFLPYNPKTEKVFFVHHKKAGLWISPGGHIDRGEGIKDAVIRELKEELGLSLALKNIHNPFLLTICDIEERDKSIADKVTRPLDFVGRSCKTHFDIWHLIEIGKEKFEVDKKEFYDTGWFGIEEALNLLTDENNRMALRKILTTL
ncbi:MAG: hypothetical protein UT63_C0018G0011 [Candidatus Gottesmanbacteria bacterium GW2011_GWC2_39_8]|uniref:Nudix hydrolase domain-containing protein n=1 Tax=Candidatus Gottesmanbacteria bacterium GW2011_GWC2_39_8 TaxID=1618450 RepID=A0A0G0Q7R2_9BACT|nr:MAG: hypothetical protein UT63_C0018G0011 [Candidatus Gottesmanbacteria bacterium GW2011_GWC2_39_8]